MNPNTRRYLGLILFAVGVLVGAGLSAGIVWASIEASSFDVPFLVDEPVDSFSCPTILTPHEQATISATITNSANRETNRFISATQSQGFISYATEDRDQYVFQPGESRTLSWEISADAPVWGRFVFARVYVHRQGVLLAQSSVCGMLSMNVPYLTGGQIFAALLLLTFGGMGAGLWLWRSSYDKLLISERRRLMMMLMIAGLVTVTFLISWLQQWLFGGIFLLLGFIVAFSLLTSPPMND